MEHDAPLYRRIRFKQEGISLIYVSIAPEANVVHLAHHADEWRQIQMTTSECNDRLATSSN